MTRSDDHSDSRETSEQEFLTRAVRLAADNAAVGQLPFGALVVRDGEVIADGVNTALKDSDPTAHAEVAAVRNACLKLGVLDLTGSTVVSSCEPCAVCHAVAAAVGITRIVYAAPKEFVPDLGDPVRSDYERLMTGMQQALRALAPDQVVYIPIDGADEPFGRFLAYLDRGS
jgi:guanine deaminase